MLTPTAELAVFQSLWAMEDLPTARTPWTLPEQAARISEAGFAGLAVDLGARQAPTAADLAPLLAEHDLAAMVFAFVGDRAGLDSAIEYAHGIGAIRMVVCAQIYGFDPVPLCETLTDWYETCRQAGITMQVETHRNTVTNDLRFTNLLLGHLDPRIEVAGDLSHFVCANELPDDPTPEHEALITAVLERCGSLQGRIATRGQVQVPLGTPAGAGWERRFRGWWETGFRSIQRRHPGEQIVFCTELGTRPYAITDVDGNELSDRWHEALILKEWAAQAFRAATEELQEQR
ncbi:sugar phosphate isomerase/epimerase family protein [Gordonia insulae]|uniref:Xylose isomerase-like TIM barrel domain-containing protein n=1 Tax=Gordonia insulae TaxID=2420509 RepID=A0A3G8JHX4_9ACTN|nr:sugar phosphate isomerase/epimerase [Gordonia insulae]AZG44686.1 hypothetical protein D7316_01272 [Gordonia insulae]